MKKDFLSYVFKRFIINKKSNEKTKCDESGKRQACVWINLLHLWQILVEHLILGWTNHRYKSKPWIPRQTKIEWKHRFTLTNIDLCLKRAAAWLVDCVLEDERWWFRFSQEHPRESPFKASFSLSHSFIFLIC